VVRGVLQAQVAADHDADVILTSKVVLEFKATDSPIPRVAFREYRLVETVSPCRHAKAFTLAADARLGGG
jgi:hypothetical protein